MKMILSNKTVYVLVIGLVFVTALSVAIYVQAAGGEIKACVNTSGAIYIIGEGFKKTTCAKGEQPLTWSQQGPQGEIGPKGDKGDTGEQGDPGLSAQHGTGNIAFTYHDKLLKTDGTVWRAFAGNIPFTQIDCSGNNGVCNVPIPVSDIVDWQYSNLIDKNGNYWFINEGGLQSGWQNFGPLP